ncbi:MAG: hypothetical protein R3E66_09570 [bacterium]
MMKKRFTENPLGSTTWWRHYFWCGLIATLSLATSACGASGNEIRQRQLEQMDEEGPAEILYRCIVEEMASRAWPTALTSERNLLVAGEFRELGPQIRQRVVARVVRFPNGVALNVQFEYQRLVREGAASAWTDATDDLTVQKARADEAEFGSAVQSRFAAKQ